MIPEPPLFTSAFPSLPSLRLSSEGGRGCSSSPPLATVNTNWPREKPTVTQACSSAQHSAADREEDLPVEGEHAARDGHVHGHLGRHPANEDHLLSCVWMEGRVIHILGLP